MENNDYEYMSVLIGGGALVDSLPILILPGSYFYMSGKRFKALEYREPTSDEYDLQIYCEEVENDISIKSIRRELKIITILQ